MASLDLMDTSLSKLLEIVKERGAWRAAGHGIAKIGHNQVTEHSLLCSCMRLQLQICVPPVMNFHFAGKITCYYIPGICRNQVSSLVLHLQARRPAQIST